MFNFKEQEEISEIIFFSELKCFQVRSERLNELANDIQFVGGQDQNTGLHTVLYFFSTKPSCSSN